MGLIDAFWHFGNFFAAGLGVGLLAAVLCKGVVWRQALRAVGWARVVRWAVLGGWAGMLLGLLLSGGHDGRMAVHVLTLVGVAAGLWWAGFLKPARA